MRLHSILFAHCAWLTACGGGWRPGGGQTEGVGVPPGQVGYESDDNGKEARALVRDAEGRDLGVVILRDDRDGLTVSGALRGLPPGVHGIHVHGVGRCQPPFDSAGDHWNPANREHGLRNPRGPHFGDLPNLTVGADRAAVLETTTRGGTLRGTNGLLDSDGAAVVVHAGPDDDRTDPSGGSGDRIACGVVIAPDEG